MSDLYESLEKLRRSTALMLYAIEAANRLQNEMKTHAPWENRTGHARQRLTAKAHKDPVKDEIVIELAQGVDYGAYLELAHEKKYAIIQPTILKKGGEVMAGFQNLMDRMTK